MQVLTSFNKVATRNAEKEEARRQQLDRFNTENEIQREVVRYVFYQKFPFLI